MTGRAKACGESVQFLAQHELNLSTIVSINMVSRMTVFAGCSTLTYSLA